MVRALKAASQDVDRSNRELSVPLDTTIVNFFIRCAFDFLEERIECLILAHIEPDAAGEGSAKACWVLMRRAKRTSLSPQAPPQNLHRFRGLRFADLKNRTGIGPHPRARKRQ